MLEILRVKGVLWDSSRMRLMFGTEETALCICDRTSFISVSALAKEFDGVYFLLPSVFLTPSNVFFRIFAIGDFHLVSLVSFGLGNWIPRVGFFHLVRHILFSRGCWFCSGSAKR